MTCCLAIKPIRVEQFDQNLREAWSPLQSYLDGIGFDHETTDWEAAFPNTNKLSAFPDELKQECYKLPPDVQESFGFGFVYEDDINCQNVNPYNQGTLIRLRLEVCAPGVKLRFSAEGRVERKDLFFDWIWVNVQKVDLLPGEEESNETILFEGGTGEGIDCEMAEKDCCVTYELPEGHYILFIGSQTGDGLHHHQAYWDLVMDVWCEGTPACPPGTDECDSDEPPMPPPHDEPPDDDDLPPHGLPAPGPGEPPTPGYRLVDCQCSNCNMLAVAVQITGLESDECEQEGGTHEVGDIWFWINDTVNLASLNGGYLCSLHGSVWYQTLGDPTVELDGVEVQYIEYKREESGILVYHSQRRKFAWKITASIACEECEVDVGGAMVPGSDWLIGSGGQPIIFDFTSWERSYDFVGEAWGQWIHVTQSAGIGGDACVLQLHWPYYTVPHVCVAPPGCFQKIYVNNGANQKYDCVPVDFYDCIATGQRSEAELWAVGSTIPCSPP